MGTIQTSSLICNSVGLAINMKSVKKFETDIDHQHCVFGPAAASDWISLQTPQINWNKALVFSFSFFAFSHADSHVELFWHRLCQQLLQSCHNSHLSAKLPVISPKQRKLLIPSHRYLPEACAPTASVYARVMLCQPTHSTFGQHSACRKGDCTLCGCPYQSPRTEEIPRRFDEKFQKIQLSIYFSHPSDRQATGLENAIRITVDDHLTRRSLNSPKPRFQKW